MRSNKLKYAEVFPDKSAYNIIYSAVVDPPDVLTGVQLNKILYYPKVVIPKCYFWSISRQIQVFLLRITGLILVDKIFHLSRIIFRISYHYLVQEIKRPKYVLKLLKSVINRGSIQETLGFHLPKPQSRLFQHFVYKMSVPYLTSINFRRNRSSLEITH